MVQEVFADYEDAYMEADAADYEEASSLAQGEVAADKTGDDPVALDPLQEARKRRQMLAELATSGKGRRKRARLTSELDEFMARNNKADSEVKDPLQWWICHAADKPFLSQMAFDLFTCPAMSAECEPVFSQTKKVITDERNRLSSNTVAAIECQKHLLRSGMLS